MAYQPTDRECEPMKAFNVAFDSLFPDPLAAQRARWAAEDKHRAELRKSIATESMQAIALLADAARQPDIGRSDLERASRHFARALAAATELDPPDEAEEEREERMQADNHGMSMDQRLDDPRHGQADSINRGR